jgi:hypothetical protein
LCILAETGGDMSFFFEDASHPVGWAGLRPGNDETAEKIRPRNILHGNKYLRQIFVEVSLAATRPNKSFSGKKYSQLSKRMKPQKALLAITRKMPVILHPEFSNRAFMNSIIVVRYHKKSGYLTRINSLIYLRLHCFFLSVFL